MLTLILFFFEQESVLEVQDVNYSLDFLSLLFNSYSGPKAKLVMSIKTENQAFSSSHLNGRHIPNLTGEIIPSFLYSRFQPFIFNSLTLFVFTDIWPHTILGSRQL